MTSTVISPPLRPSRASTSPTTSAPPSPPPPVSALVDSVSKREQLDRLGAVLPLDQIRLPHRFGSSIGPGEIAELATVLIAAIEALPEEGDE